MHQPDGFLSSPPKSKSVEGIEATSRESLYREEHKERCNVSRLFSSHLEILSKALLVQRRLEKERHQKEIQEAERDLMRLRHEVAVMGKRESEKIAQEAEKCEAARHFYRVIEAKKRIERSQNREKEEEERKLQTKAESLARMDALERQRIQDTFEEKIEQERRRLLRKVTNEEQREAVAEKVKRALSVPPTTSSPSITLSSPVGLHCNSYKALEVEKQRLREVKRLENIVSHRLQKAKEKETQQQIEARLQKEMEKEETKRTELEIQKQKDIAHKLEKMMNPGMIQHSTPTKSKFPQTQSGVYFSPKGPTKLLESMKQNQEERREEVELMVEFLRKKLTTLEKERKEETEECLSLVNRELGMAEGDTPLPLRNKKHVGPPPPRLARLKARHNDATVRSPSPNNSGKQFSSPSPASLPSPHISSVAELSRFFQGNSLEELRQAEQRTEPDGSVILDLRHVVPLSPVAIYQIRELLPNWKDVSVLDISYHDVGLEEANLLLTMISENPQLREVKTLGTIFPHPELEKIICSLASKGAIIQRTQELLKRGTERLRILEAMNAEEEGSLRCVRQRLHRSHEGLIAHLQIAESGVRCGVAIMEKEEFCRLMKEEKKNMEGMMEQREKEDNWKKSIKSMQADEAERRSIISTLRSKDFAGITTRAKQEEAQAIARVVAFEKHLASERDAIEKKEHQVRATDLKKAEMNEFTDLMKQHRQEHSEILSILVAQRHAEAERREQARREEIERREAEIVARQEEEKRRKKFEALLKRQELERSSLESTESTQRERTVGTQERQDLGVLLDQYRVLRNKLRKWQAFCDRKKQREKNGHGPLKLALDGWKTNASNLPLRFVLSSMTPAAVVSPDASLSVNWDAPSYMHDPKTEMMPSEISSEEWKRQRGTFVKARVEVELVDAAPGDEVSIFDRFVELHEKNCVSGHASTNAQRWTIVDTLAAEGKGRKEDTAVIGEVYMREQHKLGIEIPVFVGAARCSDDGIAALKKCLHFISFFRADTQAVSEVKGKLSIELWSLKTREEAIDTHKLLSKIAASNEVDQENFVKEETVRSGVSFDFQVRISGPFFTLPAQGQEEGTVIYNEGQGDGNICTEIEKLDFPKGVTSMAGALLIFDLGPRKDPCDCLCASIASRSHINHSTATMSSTHMGDVREGSALPSENLLQKRIGAPCSLTIELNDSVTVHLLSEFIKSVVFRNDSKTPSQELRELYITVSFPHHRISSTCVKPINFVSVDQPTQISFDEKEPPCFFLHPASSSSYLRTLSSPHCGTAPLYFAESCLVEDEDTTDFCGGYLSIRLVLTDEQQQEQEWLTREEDNKEKDKEEEKEHHEFILEDRDEAVETLDLLPRRGSTVSLFNGNTVLYKGNRVGIIEKKSPSWIFLTFDASSIEATMYIIHACVYENRNLFFNGTDTDRPVKLRHLKNILKSEERTVEIVLVAGGAVPVRSTTVLYISPPLFVFDSNQILNGSTQQHAEEKQEKEQEGKNDEDAETSIEKRQRIRDAPLCMMKYEVSSGQQLLGPFECLFVPPPQTPSLSALPDERSENADQKNEEDEAKRPEHTEEAPTHNEEKQAEGAAKPTSTEDNKQNEGDTEARILWTHGYLTAEFIVGGVADDVLALSCDDGEVSLVEVGGTSVTSGKSNRSSSSQNMTMDKKLSMSKRKQSNASSASNLESSSLGRKMSLGVERKQSLTSSKAPASSSSDDEISIVYVRGNPVAKVYSSQKGMRFVFERGLQSGPTLGKHHHPPAQTQPEFITTQEDVRAILNHLTFENVSADPVECHKVICINGSNGKGKHATSMLLDVQLVNSNKNSEILELQRVSNEPKNFRCNTEADQAGFPLFEDVTVHPPVASFSGLSLSVTIQAGADAKGDRLGFLSPQQQRMHYFQPTQDALLRGLSERRRLKSSIRDQHHIVEIDPISERFCVNGKELGRVVLDAPNPEGTSSIFLSFFETKEPDKPPFFTTSVIESVVRSLTYTNIGPKVKQGIRSYLLKMWRQSPASAVEEEEKEEGKNAPKRSVPAVKPGKLKVNVVVLPSIVSIPDASLGFSYTAGTAPVCFFGKASLNGSEELTASPLTNAKLKVYLLGGGEGDSIGVDLRKTEMSLVREKTEIIISETKAHICDVEITSTSVEFACDWSSRSASLKLLQTLLRSVTYQHTGLASTPSVQDRTVGINCRLNEESDSKEIPLSIHCKNALVELKLSQKSLEVVRQGGIVVLAPQAEVLLPRSSSTTANLDRGTCVKVYFASVSERRQATDGDQQQRVVEPQQRRRSHQATIPLHSDVVTIFNSSGTEERGTILKGKGGSEDIIAELQRTAPSCLGIELQRNCTANELQGILRLVGIQCLSNPRDRGTISKSICIEIWSSLAHTTAAGGNRRSSLVASTSQDPQNPEDEGAPLTKVTLPIEVLPPLLEIPSALREDGFVVRTECEPLSSVVVPSMHFVDSGASFSIEVLPPLSLSSEAEVEKATKSPLEVLLSISASRQGVSITTPAHEIMYQSHKVGQISVSTPGTITGSLVKERGKSISSLLQKLLNSISCRWECNAERNQVKETRVMRIQLQDVAKGVEFQDTIKLNILS